MAFWRIGNGFSSVSPIDKILDKHDHSLVDLLNEPDLLQELLAPNTKLIEYLRQPEVMAEMIRYIADLNDSLDDEGGGDGGGAGADDDDEKRKSLDKPLPSLPDEGPDLSSAMVDDDDEDDGELDLHTGGVDDVDMAETDDGAVTQVKRGRESDSDSNSDKEDDEDPAVTAASSKLKTKSGLLNRAGYAEDEEEEEEEEDEDEDGNHHTGLDAYDSSYDDIQENKQRHAQVCSEILSADVWSLTEALMEYTDLIEEIWKILDYPTPLDISYASYFTKISEHLLDKKTDEMLAFIRGQKNFVKRFMKHIDNPPLMDFLLKVISSDKSDNSTGIIEVSGNSERSEEQRVRAEPGRRRQKY